VALRGKVDDSQSSESKCDTNGGINPAAVVIGAAMSNRSTHRVGDLRE
jgi:hypothetical protein